MSGHVTVYTEAESTYPAFLPQIFSDTLGSIQPHIPVKVTLVGSHTVH